MFVTLNLARYLATWMNEWMNEGHLSGDRVMPRAEMHVRAQASSGILLFWVALN